MNDVFYLNGKPNAHPKERHAASFADAAKSSSTDHFWIIDEHSNYAGFNWDFDFEALPDEDVWAKDFINIWPSTHTKDSGTWLCPKNLGDMIQIIRTDVTPLARKPTRWNITPDTDVTNFDFTWQPEFEMPPYIYQFGTLVDPDDGPRYVSENDNGIVVHIERTDKKINGTIFPRYPIKTTLLDLIEEHPSEIFWALNPDIDYSSFDFSWYPNAENVYHVNTFLSTQTSFVNGKMWGKGYRDTNYIDGSPTPTKLDMFFVDRGNPEANARFAALSKTHTLIRTRFHTSWVDTITRCINRSKSKLCWILDSTLDYSDFTFDFYPSPWQMSMTHVFGTQWSHWGTTYLVAKSFLQDSKYIRIAEHLPNLHFVKQTRAKATHTHLKMWYDPGPDYIDTFRNILTSLPDHTEPLWLCSTICDYSDFDFTYIPDPFTNDKVHVFPSDSQKYGDTFLITPRTLRPQLEKATRLEDLPIHFNGHLKAKRQPHPVIVTHDTHTIPTFTGPLATLVTSDQSATMTRVVSQPISLWSADHKVIQIESTGGTRITVPREAIGTQGELTSYPYIRNAPKMARSHPLDIVFLSNGEPDADENYQHLVDLTRHEPNRLVRSDGINGRVAAYHAAANLSKTPWFFAVFAKLKVSGFFPWDWQPDRMQHPKHTIFHATNPVNGLVYGHQAMIAYNKKLVLSNSGNGLDFTLDNLHSVEPILSGTANFNSDPFSTWRTAFREAVKLRANIDAMSRYRLQIWLTQAHGPFAHFALQGASDAVEYFDDVNGDPQKLRLSYDWAWLKERFDK